MMMIEISGEPASLPQSVCPITGPLPVPSPARSQLENASVSVLCRCGGVWWREKGGGVSTFVGLS